MRPSRNGMAGLIYHMIPMAWISGKTRQNFWSDQTIAPKQIPVMKEENARPAGMISNHRKLLKIAGAAAVALLFLEPAFATCQPGDPNCPNPWMMRGSNGRVGDADCHGNADDPLQGMISDNIPITGVRHYCVQNGTIPTTWPTVDESIPFKTNVSLCVTIYPDHDKLLNGGYDGDLKSFLDDGASK